MMLGKKSLDSILGVFTKTMKELEAYVKLNDKEVAALDTQFDAMIVTRAELVADSERANDVLGKIKNIIA